MDCDGQHEPARIPVLLEAIHDCDIVSGSRYLPRLPPGHAGPDRPPVHQRHDHAGDQRPLRPEPHRRVLRVQGVPPRGLEKLRITESGWGMPLQLWVQAARQGLRVKEIGVPRLYLDPNRALRRRDERPGPSGWRTTAACSRVGRARRTAAASQPLPPGACPELAVMARLPARCAQRRRSWPSPASTPSRALVDATAGSSDRSDVHDRWRPMPLRELRNGSPGGKCWKRLQRGVDLERATASAPAISPNCRIPASGSRTSP